MNCVKYTNTVSCQNSKLWADHHSRCFGNKTEMIN